MTRKIKQLLVALGAGLGALGLMAATYSRTETPVGTLYANHASVFVFNRDCSDGMILENRNPNNAAIHVLFNESTSATSVSTTVSSTVKDLTLNQNERVILSFEHLGRFPIRVVAVTTTCTAPKLTLKGW